MAETKKMTKGQALHKFAVDTLHTRATYEEAHAANKAYAIATEVLADLRADLRGMEQDFKEAELEFISELQLANAEMSATAFKAFRETEAGKDENLKRMTRDILQTKRTIGQSEAKLDSLKMTLRVTCAHMEMLGGQLHFYASAAVEPTPPVPKD